MNKKLFYILSLCVVLFSCEEKVRRKVPEKTEKQAYAYVENHKMLLAYEDSLINDYIQEKGWQMQKTPTGLYYNIEASGMNNEFPVGTLLELDYTVHRLNDELVYSSEELGFMQVVMHKDHTIKGLKEGIAMMKKGKKARFIIPSRLAYGISGDMNKIQVSEVLVYDIELKTINNQKLN